MPDASKASIPTAALQPQSLPVTPAVAATITQTSPGAGASVASRAAAPAEAQTAAPQPQTATFTAPASLQATTPSAMPPSTAPVQSTTSTVSQQEFAPASFFSKLSLSSVLTFIRTNRSIAIAIAVALLIAIIAVVAFSGSGSSDKLQGMIKKVEEETALLKSR